MNYFLQRLRLILHKIDVFIFNIHSSDYFKYLFSGKGELPNISTP